MEIYFLRHGRSLADDEQRIEGRYDSPLTQRGKEQALKRARQWKEKGLTFDTIVASPLCRAAETAHIIGDILQAPVIHDEDWMEMDNGMVAGLTFAQAEEQFPKEGFQHPFLRRARGTGESTWLFMSRILRAMESLMQKPQGVYLVVAHGGSLNAAMWAMLRGVPTVEGRGFLFSFGDTGYLHTTYDADRDLWCIKAFDHGEYT